MHSVQYDCPSDFEYVAGTPPKPAVPPMLYQVLACVPEGDVEPSCVCIRMMKKPYFFVWYNKGLLRNCIN